MAAVLQENEAGEKVDGREQAAAGSGCFLRYALSARPTASQGFATEATRPNP
jgi:hypothetical protein